MGKIEIDPQEVKKVLMNCLYKKEELEEAGDIPRGAVVVEGITSKFGFHPERLEKHRDEIVKWLKALPHQFCRSSGGGWSFLNACNQENGVQWTGLHKRMEQLFCLGIALGLVKSIMPREKWSSLPGGMPYYVIEI